MDLMPRGFYLDSIFNDLVSKGSNDMKCEIIISLWIFLALIKKIFLLKQRMVI